LPIVASSGDAEKAMRSYLLKARNGKEICVVPAVCLNVCTQPPVMWRGPQEGELYVGWACPPGPPQYNIPLPGGATGAPQEANFAVFGSGPDHTKPRIFPFSMIRVYSHPRPLGSTIRTAARPDLESEFEFSGSILPLYNPRPASGEAISLY
jgi:hypothetical protein